MCFRVIKLHVSVTDTLLACASCFIEPSAVETYTSGSVLVRYLVLAAWHAGFVWPVRILTALAYRSPCCIISVAPLCGVARSKIVDTAAIDRNRHWSVIRIGIVLFYLQELGIWAFLAKTFKNGLYF